MNAWCQRLREWHRINFKNFHGRSRGPDYVWVLASGSMLELWGSVSQRLQRVVDVRGGSLCLSWTVQVSARRCQCMSSRFNRICVRNSRCTADVSLVDCAQSGCTSSECGRAGERTTSSAPFNARKCTLRGGWPTSRGSLRLLKHYRVEQLIEDVESMTCCCMA